jgi:hypothetical protein
MIAPPLRPRTWVVIFIVFVLLELALFNVDVGLPSYQ